MKRFGFTHLPLLHIVVQLFYAQDLHVPAVPYSGANQPAFRHPGIVPLGVQRNAGQAQERLGTGTPVVVAVCHQQAADRMETSQARAWQSPFAGLAECAGAGRPGIPGILSAGEGWGREAWLPALQGAWTL